MEKSNIKIIGEGSSSGGDYGTVKVTGEAEFFGNVQCEQFKCTGSAQVEGDLLSHDIKVTGTLVLKGQDASDIIGPFNLKAEEIKIMGELRIPGSCESEALKLRGSLVVGGTLSADDVDLKLHGDSHVREIGGSSISVKGRAGLSIASLFMSGNGTLKSENIEGDRIYLENTEAGYVRGEKVEIGPGCNIGFVEFKETLQIDKSSKVGGQQKV